MGGDDSASDYRFACPRRGNEHSEVMVGQRFSGLALCIGEGCREGEFLGCSLIALVSDVQSATGLFGERGDLVRHASGQDQSAIEGLLEAAQELRQIPG